MPHVAFATCPRLPDIYADDQLTANLLRSAGVTVSGVVWNDPQADWDQYDLVVIRSTWDYYLTADAFTQWIARFDGTTQLWNPPALVRNNLHKRYLLDLAAQGIPIVPTLLVPAGEAPTLATLLDAHGWSDAIVKPAISAGAHETWRSSRTAADEPRFTTQVRTSDTLLQPYMPEIATQGEWSLLFFDGVYSHAVLKRPGAGDFRVQQHLGGSTHILEPAPALCVQAQRVLHALPQTPLYARLDGIDRDGEFLLMELEITEPFLFLAYHPEAPQRFATAIQRRLMY